MSSDSDEGAKCGECGDVRTALSPALRLSGELHLTLTGVDAGMLGWRSQVGADEEPREIGRATLAFMQGVSRAYLSELTQAEVAELTLRVAGEDKRYAVYLTPPDGHSKLAAVCSRKVRAERALKLLTQAHAESTGTIEEVLYDDVQVCCDCCGEEIE